MSRSRAAAIRRLFAAATAATVLSALVGSAAVAAPAVLEPGARRAGWSSPVQGGARAVAGYVAPPHPYGAGHRGIDVEPAAGARLVAPADGVVAFTGMVADRPLVTLAHAGDVVTTFEPVRGAWPAGTRVRRGDVVGVIDSGGHASPGTVHVGARIAGAYVSPLLLWGDLPRAVLLPCC